MFGQAIPDIESWPGWKKLWKLRLPPKIKIFSWKLLHQRLPTLDYLVKLGFHSPNICILCKQDVEYVHHLFYKCAFTSAIWVHLEHQHRGLDLTHVIERGASWHLSNSEVNILELILITYWQVWKERNATTFRNELPNALRVGRTAWIDHKDFEFAFKKAGDDRNGEEEEFVKTSIWRFEDQYQWSLG